MIELLEWIKDNPGFMVDVLFYLFIAGFVFLMLRDMWRD